MKNLNETYLKIQRILGEQTESLESVQLVETYRRFLKPNKVRVILLAESHVFTHDADRKVSIPPIPEREKGTGYFLAVNIKNQPVPFSRTDRRPGK